MEYSYLERLLHFLNCDGWIVTFAPLRNPHAAVLPVGEVIALAAQAETSFLRATNGTWTPHREPPGVLLPILAATPANTSFSGVTALLVRRHGAPRFGEIEIGLGRATLRELLRLMPGTELEIPAPRPSLPPRLLSTWALLVEGCSRKDIADALGLSVNTVSSYVKEIYRAERVSSQPELMNKRAAHSRRYPYFGE